MQNCELDNWKEALAALLTYAHPEDFASFCGKLNIYWHATQILTCLASGGIVKLQFSV